MSPTAADRDESVAYADAFIAGFRSPDTRRAYRRDLECWLTFCVDQDVHGDPQAVEREQAHQRVAGAAFDLGGGEQVGELVAVQPRLRRA